MNTQNVWIKRSEREPKCSDLPIVTGYRYDSDGWQQSAWFCVPPNTSDSPYTHWRSIKADPPSRELTQRERDEATVLQLRQRLGTTANQDCLDAIYAERREVAKLMAKAYDSAWGTSDVGWSTSLRQLRARLDEQGAK